MKKFSKLFAIALVFVVALTLTGCGKKESKKEEEKTDNANEYADYIGYQFSGKDPWGGELAITIRTLEGEKLTWTYTDVIGSGESAITLYTIVESEYIDGRTLFGVSGNADKENMTFNYIGSLSMVDGKLIVEYTNGSIEENSTEGGSASYQVGPLEESARKITLTKVVDNS